MRQPIIIGQAPARGNDGKPPFAGQSGARLAQLAGVGDSGDVLPEHFEMYNLNAKWSGKRIGGKGHNFDMKEARKKATQLKNKMEAEIDPLFILLMGRNVERAFGWKSLEYLDVHTWLGHYVILFPHPSGINHFWNDEGNVDAAKAMLRWALRASS